MPDKIKKLLQNPLFLLAPFYLWLLIDTFNGLVVRFVDLPITISNVFKAIVLLLALITIRDKKLMYLAASAIGLITLAAIIHLFNPLSAGTSAFTTLYEDGLAGIKLLSPIIFTLSFWSLLKRLDIKNTGSHLRLILLANLAVIIFNLVVSLIGVGYSQYKADIGAKGFFLSGNELAITFLTIASAVLYFRRNHNSVVFIVFCAALVLCSLLIGTKVAIFGTVIVIVLVALLLRYDFIANLFAHRKPHKRLYLWFIILLVCAGIGGLIVWRLPYIHSMIRRLDAMIFYAGNPISGILSQRDVLAGSALTFIKAHFTVPDYLFGVGYNNISKAMSVYPPYRTGITELDGVDLFLYLGSLSLLYYGLWVYMLVKMITKKPVMSAAIFSFSVNLLLLAISSFSGHTVFSAINAPFWGIINVIGLSRATMKINPPKIWTVFKSFLIRLYRSKVLFVLPSFVFIASDVISTMLRTTSRPTITVSLVFKAFAVALLLPLLGRKSKIALIAGVATVLILTGIHALNPLTHAIGLRTLVFGDLQFGFKLLLPFAFAFAFFRLGKTLNPKTFKLLVILIFATNFLLIIGNELIGIYKLYGVESLTSISSLLGQKGLLFSWNEFSIGYVTITSYLLYRMRNKNFALLILLAGLVVFGTVMVSKKVAIFGVLFFTALTFIIFRYDFWLNLIHKKARHLLSYICWVGGLAIVGVSIVLILPRVVDLSTLAPTYTFQIERVQYAYNQFQEGNSDPALTALFSGRNEFVQSAAQVVQNDFTHADHLFGIGYPNINTAMSKYQPDHPGITELDPVDMYMATGSISVVVFYVFWLGFIVWLGFQLKRAPFFGYSFFLNLFLVAASVTSGHIIYSGLNGAFWGILNGTVLAVYFWKQPKHQYNVLLLTGLGQGGVGMWAQTVSKYLRGKLGQRYQVIRTHAEVHQNFRNSLVYLGALLKAILFALTHIGQTNIYHLNVEQGGSFVRAAIMTWTLGLFPGSNIVLHIHGSRFFEYAEKLKKSRKGKLLFRMLFTNSAVKSVISLTPSGQTALKKLLEEWTIIPGFEHFVLSNPIEFDLLKSANLKRYYSGGTLELINIARYVPQKNQLAILKAVLQLVSAGTRNIHLSLVGDGELRPEFEAFIEDHKLERYVTLTGWVGLEQKKQYLEKADVMVIPSLFESFGIVVLEAYANNIPVVASNTRGLADLVVEGENGTKVEASNIDQIVTAIKQYINNPRIIQTQGERNFIKSKQFDLSIIGKQLIDIYEKSTFRRTPKLMLIASSGGHLNQLMMLKPWWGKYRRMFVAYDKIDGRTLLIDEPHVLSKYTNIRNPFHVFATAWIAYKTLKTYRPDLILSTGEGLCVPFFYIGKYLFGAKTIMLDSLSKTHPSLSAYLSYFVVDELLTQWPNVTKKWKRFKYIGRVI